MERLARGYMVLEVHVSAPRPRFVYELLDALVTRLGDWQPRMGQLMNPRSIVEFAAGL